MAQRCPDGGGRRRKKDHRFEEIGQGRILDDRKLETPSQSPQHYIGMRIQNLTGQILALCVFEYHSLTSSDQSASTTHAISRIVSDK